MPEPIPEAQRAADPSVGAEVEAALQALEVDLGTKSVRRLCGIFLEDVVRRRARLAAAFERGSVEDIHLEAHGLKSSISNFRASAAMKAANALEVEDDVARLRDGFATFAREADVLQAIVLTYVEP